MSFLDLVRTRRAELEAAEPKPREYSDADRARMLVRLSHREDCEGLLIFVREKCPDLEAAVRAELDRLDKYWAEFEAAKAEERAAGAAVGAWRGPSVAAGAQRLRHGAEPADAPTTPTAIEHEHEPPQSPHQRWRPAPYVLVDNRGDRGDEPNDPIDPGTGWMGA